jgi:hypothetical protein
MQLEGRCGGLPSNTFSGTIPSQQALYVSFLFPHLWILQLYNPEEASVLNPEEASVLGDKRNLLIIVDKK